MKLHDLFADILEPPRPLLPDRVDECVSTLATSQREAAGLMKQFKTFLDRTPLTRMGEIYTGTFGLQAGLYPYVGTHLFGDGSHRRMFLAGLEEQYQIYNFSTADELPDHLGIMLRFLAQVGDEEEREEMTFLYILPALKKMLKGFEDQATPYKSVFQALLLVLREGRGISDDRVPAGMETQEFPYGR